MIWEAKIILIIIPNFHCNEISDDQNHVLDETVEIVSHTPATLPLPHTPCALPAREALVMRCAAHA